MKKLSIAGYITLFFFVLALLAPWIAQETTSSGIFPLIKHGPETVDLFSAFLSAPDGGHFLGTDYVGRDIAARLVHGIKNSLFFSLAVVTLCLLMGMILGGIMGFFGGWIDLTLSRFLEIVANFPIFLLQLTLLAFLPQSYSILLFVMLISGWIPYCRFTRAEFLRLRNQEYVQAAVVMGASRPRIFMKHLFPNSLTPIITYVPFDLSSTITTLGALSFLGFGEPINVASLGELMKQAKDHFQEAWWLAVFPGGTLFLLTFSLALFGSSLRDRLDPRQAHKLSH